MCRTRCTAWKEFRDFAIFTKKIMVTSGYSGTALLKKLGIKEDMKVLLIGAPAHYFTLLERDISPQLAGKKETPDLVHLFVKSKKELVTEMKQVNAFAKLNPLLILWISWYKKSAGIVTDVTENDIRSYGLQNDWVDIKVCAVDEQWSGLKFVVPKAKR